MTPKLGARDRIAPLVDPKSFVEDGSSAGGVITGRGAVDDRPAIVVASDPTVDAGRWEARSVEKVVRATESALREELPVFWLLDAVGEPKTGPAPVLPGRRDMGRILHHQARLRGVVPQICCLFGPVESAGVFIPGLADVVVMVDGAASMALGSPRSAGLVTGAQVSREELGGARMHCAVAGTGDLLVQDDAEAIELARLYFSYVPSTSWQEPPAYLGEEPAAALTTATVPDSESRPFDIHEVIDGLVDDDSFFELKSLFAPELVVGFGRLDGRTVGIVANNSVAEGGVLSLDGVDKASGFIGRCDAYSIPLIHLVDVPGFAIGAEAERGGIIRRGAKLVAAVAAATVPQLCVIIRRAYGAGLFAMCGPGLGPEATIALPTARISARTHVDPHRLAADLVVDSLVEAAQLRAELLRRLRYGAGRGRAERPRRRGIPRP